MACVGVGSTARGTATAGPAVVRAAVLLTFLAAWSAAAATAADPRLVASGAAGHQQVHAAQGGTTAAALGADVSNDRDGWPRPDRPDHGGKLLPFRSGDIINVRSLESGLYCNTRDLDMPEDLLQQPEADAASGTTAATADADGGNDANDAQSADSKLSRRRRSSATLRHVMVCDAERAAGPGQGELMVVGKDFVTDQVAEGSRFYLKSQRTNKFCVLRDVDTAARGGGGDWPSGGGDWPSGGGDWPSGGGDWLSGGGGSLQQQQQRDLGSDGMRRSLADWPSGGGDWPSGGGDWPSGGGDYPGGGGKSPDLRQLLLVVCDQIHYDKFSEWTAVLGPKDGQVVLVPGVKGARPPCFPRRSDGLMVCNSRHPPKRGSAQPVLEVETGGWRPSGGVGPDDYPTGGGDANSAGADASGSGAAAAATAGGASAAAAGAVGWPHGPDRPDEPDDDDVLPFSTGQFVYLTSPWLYDASCVAPPHGYYPYTAITTATDKEQQQRQAVGGSRRLRAAAGRVAEVLEAATDGTHDAQIGGAASVAALGRASRADASSIVYCNATMDDDDSPPGSYPPYPSGWAPPWSDGSSSSGSSGERDAQAVAVASAGAHALEGGDGVSGGGAGGWDTPGFVIMGTDFMSPSIKNGGRVFLKSQATRKFCRVAGPELRYALVCDEMMSDEHSTAFVVEIARPHKRKVGQEEEAEYERGGSSSGGSGGHGKGGGGRGGGGGGHHGGGGGGEPAEVYVYLRAPSNDMRWCEPDDSHRDAPIVCNMRRPDRSSRQRSVFKLVEVPQPGRQ